MSNNCTTLDPSDPDDRVEIVRIALKRQGLSFAGLSRQLEVNPSTIALVLRGHKSARLEPLIAARIGWTPQQLFPRHYDANGNRTARTRSLCNDTPYTKGPGVKTAGKIHRRAA